MKTFKEYRAERKAVPPAKPSMETFMGSHSTDKKVKPSMETFMGSHSTEKTKVNESSGVMGSLQRKLSTDTDHDKNIHENLAPMGKISKTEADHVQDYTDNSRTMNGLLHRAHQGYTINPDKTEGIKTLSKVLDRHKTKKDFHVFTGLHSSPAKHFKTESGKTEEFAHVHLPAFTSTSTNSTVARGFSEPTHDKNDKNHGVVSGNSYDEGAKHILKIHVPAGTSAASLRKHSFVPDEHEILLNRGHDIKIHSKPEIQDNPAFAHKTYIWHAEITGHTPKKID